AALYYSYSSSNSGADHAFGTSKSEGLLMALEVEPDWDVYSSEQRNHIETTWTKRAVKEGTLLALS
ncbi:unnamed protein product, partial [Amoebophrya sp. A25]